MTKSVLITGGAGFIGTHVARELHASGHRVRILGDIPPVPGLIPAEVELLRGDARRAADLERALDRIDAVFHFASAGRQNPAMQEVASYVENDSLATATLLQLLTAERRRPRIERLIVASSMSLYGEGYYRDRHGNLRGSVRRAPADLRERRWDPLDEDGRPLEPVPTSEDKPADLASVHALSKYDQERLCLNVAEAYGFTATVLRFFNVYGPGQDPSGPHAGVMASFASRLLNDLPPVLFEDGRQRRDFLHVSDAARACRLALERAEAAGQVINVGSGRDHTVLEAARRMAEIMGKPHLEPEITGRHRPGDVRHCFADVTKARRVLGFEPSVTLADGMTGFGRWLSRQAVA